MNFSLLSSRNWGHCCCDDYRVKGEGDPELLGEEHFCLNGNSSRRSRSSKEFQSWLSGLCVNIIHRFDDHFFSMVNILLHPKD